MLLDNTHYIYNIILIHYIRLVNNLRKSINEQMYCKAIKYAKVHLLVLSNIIMN